MCGTDCDSGYGLEKGREVVGAKRRSLPCWGEAGWSPSISQEHVAQDPESRRKKVVGEPYEGKPHGRFEVAGDGNQDMVVALRHSQEETESNELPHLSLRCNSLNLI